LADYLKVADGLSGPMRWGTVPEGQPPSPDPDIEYEHGMPWEPRALEPPSEADRLSPFDVDYGLLRPIGDAEIQAASERLHEVGFYAAHLEWLRKLASLKLQHKGVFRYADQLLLGHIADILRTLAKGTEPFRIAERPPTIRLEDRFQEIGDAFIAAAYWMFARDMRKLSDLREAWRIRLCEICDAFFWAKQRRSRTCGELRCKNTASQRDFYRREREIWQLYQDGAQPEDIARDHGIELRQVADTIYRRTLRARSPNAGDRGGETHCFSSEDAQERSGPA
jgi:hypothetical protein